MRGYETGLYYLQSRYYDPEIGRFINADDVDYLGASGTTLSYNLFAYCENNPVNNSDPNGCVIQWIVGAIAGGLLNVVSYFLSNFLFGEKSTTRGICLSFISGAVSGFVSATSVKLVGQILANVAINLINVGCNYTKKMTQSQLAFEVVYAVASGVISSIAGGSGLGNKKFFSSQEKRMIKKMSKSKIKSVAKSIAYYFKNTKKLYKNNLFGSLKKAFISNIGVTSAKKINSYFTK